MAAHVTNAQRTVVGNLVLAALIVGTHCPEPACAQRTPARTVRIVVPGVGGGGDLTARLIAQGISGPLGQQVIVDNKPFGVIPGEIVAKSPPDGSTLLLSGSTLWLAPFMQDNVPYDPARDFAPITTAATAPNILVVHPSLPVRSVKDLVVLAKNRPGQLNYASGAAGSSTHLAPELFKAMTGINIVRVPYGSATVGLTDLMSGQIQLMFPTGGSVMSYVKAGRLRALAVTSAQPSALVPGVPTIAETGLPGYESTSVSGILGPSKTSAEIVKRFNHEIGMALNRPEIKEKLFNAGLETSHSSPEQFAARIKFDMGRMGKVIKDAGIRAE